MHVLVDTVYRTKVQRLPIDPISQASGIRERALRSCFLMVFVFVDYSEDDFISRAQFTDPEILRTNLYFGYFTNDLIGLRGY